MAFLRRNLRKKLENTVRTFAAAYISGARQCGKSTMVKNLVSLKNTNYLTFDTTSVRVAAKNDPETFINGLPKDKLNIIDEIQRVPAVHVPIKKVIDEQRLKGEGKALFLLTGSANIYALPNLAKAMVGRMAELTLYPFSAAEIMDSGMNFIEKLWNSNLSFKNYKQPDLINMIQNATFPEISLDKKMDWGLWMDSYLDTIFERDAVEISKIRKTDLIYQLLVSLTSRVGNLLNNENIMKETGLNQATYEKYKSFCNAAFLTFEIQPWAKPNRLDKRFVKSRKIYFTDTNLLCFLARYDLPDVYKNNSTLMGHLFENFIATEIVKAISVLPGKFYVSHFNPVRGDGNETDFVIEKDNGETIAIEVKLDSSLNGNDFKNLELCRNTIGNKFIKGIVLYTGNELVPFGEKLWAVPVNYLWEE
ncbi:MAG: ATP-binding protein [Treponema sp.]|nr:ATP-binding protein [Treponema sp.]